MKTYHVSANRRLGFWLVMENNAGHYRQVARYSTQNAAAKAAETLNEQHNSREGASWVLT